MSIRIIVRCQVCHCTSDISVGGSYEDGKPFYDPRPSLQREGWVFDEWGERCGEHAAPPEREVDEDDARAERILEAARALRALITGTSTSKIGTRGDG